jgi:two-component system response regulator MprA
MGAAPCRIFLVDNDVRATKVLAQMLREDGFDVEVTFDGAMAIGRLGRAPMPDVLITNYQLPHVDGLTIARFARSRAEQLPVLMVTGYREVLEPAAKEFDPPVRIFGKPIAYAELLRELEIYKA